jgi:hypothetical protein
MFLFQKKKFNGKKIIIGEWFHVLPKFLETMVLQWYDFNKQNYKNIMDTYYTTPLEKYILQRIYILN